MNYEVWQVDSVPYVECIPDGTYIHGEREALDLVAACGENRTHRLLLHAENLTDDFYNLKTRLAGEILLRFAVYHLKVAAVIPREVSSQGKFAEFVVETNRGNDFRVFQGRAAAEKWLVGGD